MDKVRQASKLGQFRSKSVGVKRYALEVARARLARSRIASDDRATPSRNSAKGYVQSNQIVRKLIQERKVLLFLDISLQNLR